MGRTLSDQVAELERYNKMDELIALWLALRLDELGSPALPTDLAMVERGLIAVAERVPASESIRNLVGEIVCCGMTGFLSERSVYEVLRNIRRESRQHAVRETDSRR